MSEIVEKLIEENKYFSIYKKYVPQSKERTLKTISTIELNVLMEELPTNMIKKIRELAKKGYNIVSNVDDIAGNFVYPII